MPWISDFEPTSTPCVGSSRMRIFGFVASRFDAKLSDVAGGDFRFFAAIDQAAGGNLAKIGERDVRGDGHIEHHAVTPAVFGDIADSLPDRRGGRFDSGRIAVDDNFAALGGRESEDGFGELCAAGADEAGNAEDLARAHGE